MEECPLGRTCLSHMDLVKLRLKSYRNGNWRKLRAVERALFKASIELAKLRGIIVNPSLVNRLRAIASKLLQTATSKILQLGMEYASSLLELYGRNGVFKWAPSVKSWLKDPGYVFWLGVNQLTLQSLGYL